MKEGNQKNEHRTLNFYTVLCIHVPLLDPFIHTIRPINSNCTKNVDLMSRRIYQKYTRKYTRKSSLTWNWFLALEFPTSLQDALLPYCTFELTMKPTCSMMRLLTSDVLLLLELLPSGSLSERRMFASNKFCCNTFLYHHHDVITVICIGRKLTSTTLCLLIIVHILLRHRRGL